MVTSKSMYWIISSFLYSSYNSVSLIPILISFKKYIKTKKEIKFISFFTVIIMLILSLIIYFLINNYWTEIKGVEIPIVSIASKLGKTCSFIHGLLILGAIFTTAISAGYGFLNNITKSKKTYIICSLLICAFSIFFGQLEFSGLISLIYPVLGYLGLMQIFFLLIA